MSYIESADYVADYKIKVEFNDGFSFVVDTISANTILWAVGVDFAPEFVRSLVK
ncbi:hypothetical protein [Fibrobacter sp.]|uniref:hypothetical protein n=1 Tax=Fibrobacter sp. TaxID=35828 RepID=UPI00388E7565